MMYAFPLQVLITVVDRGKGDKMARLYERSGVKTQLMCLGFGTAKSEILEYLGLGDLEKEILFSAAPRAAIQTGLEKLRGELPFSRPGGGVACSVTFSSVSMAALRHIQKEATIIETGEAEKWMRNGRMIWLSALQTGGRRSWLWRRRSRLGPAAAQSFTHGALTQRKKKIFCIC